MKNKEKYTGVTVHLVNSKLDSGKIIAQKRIKLSLDQARKFYINHSKKTFFNDFKFTKLY